MQGCKRCNPEPRRPANRKAAQDWLGDYKKAEGDGFLFNSEAGEIVEPLR